MNLNQPQSGQCALRPEHLKQSDINAADNKSENNVPENNLPENSVPENNLKDQPESATNKSFNPRKELLTNYPALAEIQHPAWDDAIQSANEAQIPAGQIVYDGHNKCNTFVLLLKGTIRVYHIAPDGREITLYRVTPGDLCVLSLTSLLKNRHYNVIAKAEDDAVALCISEPSFRDVVGKSERFRDFVLSSLSERLCDLMFLVQDTVFQTLQVRLACVLVRMFAIADNIRIDTTHQSLAQELGTTREVISRILKDFENKDAIKITRGHIEVLSFDGLERLAHPIPQ